MIGLSKVISVATQRQRIERLLRETPSPSLARNHLLRLLEKGGAKALNKVSAVHGPSLIRLIGSSSYLSDVLIRQGKNWPELFLGQIKIPQKSVTEHLAELIPQIKESQSLDDFCAILRRHKQREYVRIGARDLLPSVSMEETVRELTALDIGR